MDISIPRLRRIVLVVAALSACAGPERHPSITIAPASPPPPVEAPVVRASPKPAPAPTADCDAPPAQAGAVNVPVAVDGRSFPPSLIKARLNARLGGAYFGGVSYCSYQVLGVDLHKLYVWAWCGEVLIEDGRPTKKSGISVPAVLDVDASGDRPEILGARTPGDGSAYGRDIQAMFSDEAQKAMRRMNRGLLEQALFDEAMCRARAGR